MRCKSFPYQVDDKRWSREASRSVDDDDSTCCLNVLFVPSLAVVHNIDYLLLLLIYFCSLRDSVSYLHFSFLFVFFWLFLVIIVF